jgi:hypothetical protein
MTATALFAGLVTAGAAAIGYAAISDVSVARAGHPIQEATVAQAAPRSASAKPAADQGPVLIQVDVVDTDGHRLSGADVVARLFYSSGSGNAEQVVERRKTDGAGHVQFEVVREREGRIMRTARVWAYQPGRALAMSSVLLAGTASPPAIQLTLNEPAKWTITVVGADDRPIGGLRIKPHSFRRTDGRTALPTVVDAAFEEPLTLTTDGKGSATLTYLDREMAPLSIGISGAGFAPHMLPIDVAQGKAGVLKLGRPGRVVGIVRTAFGQPLAGVPVELWVQGSGTLPSGVLAIGNRQITGNAIVRLDQEPLKTGPQGVFQTPSTLLSGSTYRVSIRKGGFVPFISDWVTLSGERTAIPDIRLKPLQKLTGQIKDRQGRAIAGARAFLPAGGPATATDSRGRFALAGIDPGKAIILVEKTGFRLHGWLIDPSLQPEMGSLTLARTSESPEPVMKPLADPIPPAESRALANRLLAPYLPDELENADDEPRLSAIVALSEFDVDRALELFENGKFRNEGFRYQTIRGSLAVKLAVKDPARAQAMAESVPNPMMKVRGLSGVVKALPASERVRKQAVLERATTLLRDRLQHTNAAGRLGMLLEIAEVAEQWLDIGERDRARPLLDEGKTLNDVFQAQFLGQLGRLEPTEVMPRLQKFSAPPNRNNPNYRNDMLAELAVQLAADRPALAEQVFNLRDGSGDQNQAVYREIRLCRRLARVDPATARRVAASLIGTGTRACGWASVAAGLAEKDKAGASEALNRSIQEIDRVRESGPGPETVFIVNGIRLMPPTNPAAQILPIVERIAPERLAEVFWRAVALHPRIETDDENQLQTSYIGKECTLLARYDRDVAAALFAPLNSYLQTPAARQASLAFINVAVMAKGCLDPRAAVTLIESMTPPGKFNQSDPAHRARLSLAEMLGRTAEIRWKERWRFMGAQFDD